MKNEETKKRVRTYRNDYVYSEYTGYQPKNKDIKKLNVKPIIKRKLNPITEKYEYETIEYNYQLSWESEKELLNTGNFKNKELIKA